MIDIDSIGYTKGYFRANNICISTTNQIDTTNARHSWLVRSTNLFEICLPKLVGSKNQPARNMRGLVVGAKHVPTCSETRLMCSSTYDILL